MKRYYIQDDCYGDQVEDESSTGPWVKYEDAQAAIQAAVLAEREAIAKRVDGMRPTGDSPGCFQIQIVDAIRARSKS